MNSALDKVYMPNKTVHSTEKCEKKERVEADCTHEHGMADEPIQHR
jgi:hypothetical protein